MSQEKGLLRFFGQMDIFSFIHLSITEGLSQIAADGIDFPLLFPCNIKIIIICFLLFYLAGRNALVLEKSIFFTSPISPVKDDGQTAYRRSSLPIVSFA